jgi:hypothetical protein
VVCNNTAAFIASAEEDVMEVDVICVKRANFVVKAMYYSLRPSLFQAYVDEKRREKMGEEREKKGERQSKGETKGREAKRSDEKTCEKHVKTHSRKEAVVSTNHLFLFFYPLLPTLPYSEGT